MHILGIESSCDDTSVALLACSDERFEVLAEKTASQIDVHKAFGGVVPEIAGRRHAENIFPVLEHVMQGQEKPDALAVTSGPGLITGLLVGMELAKNLSYLWNVPIVRTNHIEGHIFSTLLGKEKAEIVFPAMCLIVSGGHTELILMENYGAYTRVGATRDDASGECFDKVAKLLGMEYPGGPKISKAAAEGNERAIALPRPMIDSDDLDFSFAGLKTAALYYLQDHPDTHVADFCASFEQAIVDVLVAKTKKAALQYKVKQVVLAGGVSANGRLRRGLQEAISLPLLLPELKHCTDNAAMIAAAAYHHAKQKDFTPWDALVADPNWKLART